MRLDVGLSPPWAVRRNVGIDMATHDLMSCSYVDGFAATGEPVAENNNARERSLPGIRRVDRGESDFVSAHFTSLGASLDLFG